MATNKKESAPKAPAMSKKRIGDSHSTAVQNISREEEIGYHKGSVMTLANERNEMVRIIQTIDTIVQAHLKRMEELGVKINKK